MWAIVGLGNPGGKYSKTRHNIGFMVIDALADRLGIDLAEKKNHMIGEGLYEGEKIVLLKPLTYMNLSGIAVRTVLQYRNCPPGRLIVVHDDLDLPVGRIKIKTRGSSGGHRGIQSIIDSIGTNEFIRVKIGIGRPSDTPTEVYVLNKFTPAENDTIRESIERASEAVLSIISQGLNRTMTEYNK